MAATLPQGYEFGPPSDTTSMSEDSRYLYETYYQKLSHYRSKLPPAIQQKFTSLEIKELALVLLDGTVFEIVKELEDIQQMSERDLLNRRIKVVTSHKTQKMAQDRKHREELANCKQHNIPLIKRQHDTDKCELETKMKEKLKSTDQKIILELDQLVTDQQSTMHQAAVPMFSVTNNQIDIQLQMHVLECIQKLSQLPTTHNRS